MSHVLPAALAAVSLETEKEYARINNDSTCTQAHDQMTHARELMYTSYEIRIHSLVVGMSHKNLS